MQITELVEKAVQCLEALGLDPETIYDYRCSAFKPVAERMQLMTDVKTGNFMVHEQYFTMQYQNEKISRQTYNWRIRGIRILCEVLETGTFVWKVYSKKSKICLSGQFEAALVSYLDKQECCEKRRRCYESICRRFFQYVSPSVEVISDIKPIHVRNFIVQISETRPKSMDDVISAIKGLFRHLYETGQYEDTFWRLLSAPRSRGHKVLNCVSCDETLEILKAIDLQTNDGKRDYAILQLAAVSGFRAGDIATLKLDNIDWRNDEIHIIQGKTSEPLTLPIPHAVLASIADYVLTARPKTDDRHVFVRHCAPFCGYHDGVSISCLFRKYQKKAGLIHVVGDGKTLHGMRRGLGTGMVKQGVPVNTVAQVLGHQGIRATRQYIEADLENMQLCSLGFESLGGAEK